MTYMMMYGKHPYMSHSPSEFDMDTYIDRLENFRKKPLSLPDINI